MKSGAGVLPSGKMLVKVCCTGKGLDAHLAHDSSFRRSRHWLTAVPAPMLGFLGIWGVKAVDRNCCFHCCSAPQINF